MSPAQLFLMSEVAGCLLYTSIPYRTVFSNEPTPVLPATEVVDACLADLHQAESLLWEADHDIFVHDVNADPFLELRQFRMNRWAVKAMLARVYCYKGDEERCV